MVNLPLAGLRFACCLSGGRNRIEEGDGGIWLRSTYAGMDTMCLGLHEDPGFPIR